MGLGDAKLMAVIGFWFGSVSIPFVLFFSSVVALFWVTPALIKKSKKLTSQIPYGPYIIIASILFFVLRQKLILLL
jgi:leader peptidase (prepilin peptidase)/N-methyltransferase